MKPLRLAADTNVLLNEADGVDDVVDPLVEEPVEWTMN